MSFKDINIKDISESAPELFGDRWALIGAGDKSNHNIMTVSWGMLGRLWNKDVATVFIRPQRHTFDLVDSEDFFTINFLDEKYREALNICGDSSGTNCDKFELAKLTPHYVDETTAVEQSSFFIVCKKIAKTEMKPEDFLDESISKFYKDNDFHSVFVGEIIKVYKK